MYVISINESVECEIVASIKQLIWRLYFILMIRFFLCDRSVLSVSWGFTRQKVQLFLQRFKPGTQFFFFFFFASFSLLWFHGYRSRLLRIPLLIILSL